MSGLSLFFYTFSFSLLIQLQNPPRQCMVPPPTPRVSLLSSSKSFWKLTQIHQEVCHLVILIPGEVIINIDPSSRGLHGWSAHGCQGLGGRMKERVTILFPARFCCECENLPSQEIHCWNESLNISEWVCLGSKSSELSLDVCFIFVFNLLQMYWAERALFSAPQLFQISS